MSIFSGFLLERSFCLILNKLLQLLEVFLDCLCIRNQRFDDNPSTGNEKYYNWCPIRDVWAKNNQVRTFSQSGFVSVFHSTRRPNQQLTDQHGWQLAYDRRAAHCKQRIDLELLDLVWLKTTSRSNRLEV